jgi:cellulose biosynthesis protein BcsQ
MAGKSFAFMNLKGGVGKTVLTANLAREIVRQHNKKILLVDLDPQCSLSYLFAEPAEIGKLAKGNATHETLYPEGAGSEALLNQAKNIYTDSSFLGRPRGPKIDLIFGSMEI